MSDDKEAEDVAKDVIRLLKEQEAALNADLASKEAERRLQERAAQYEAERQKKDK